MQMSTVRAVALAIGAGALAPAQAHAQAGYLDHLTAATPDAAALLHSDARAWIAAPDIVKDRLAFFVFAEPFPARARLSPNELIQCLDREAGRAASSTAVGTLLRTCTR